MKKALKIAFVYIGLVIGAGFASGREIFEYFNLASRRDFTGIIFAAIGFCLIGCIIATLAKRFYVSSFDELIEAVAPHTALPIKLLMLAFMFCGFFTMLSASGAIFYNSFSLSPKIGIWALALLCFAVFSFDLKGIVAINSVMVPFMLIGILFLCISSILYGSAPAFSPLYKLRQSFIISALCYVSYNTVTAGSVLVPLAASNKQSELSLAALISGSVLGILIFLIWTVLNSYYDFAFSAEMPLLDLAALHGSLFKAVYAVVLFMALCTTAISHGFGIISKFHFSNTPQRVLTSALLCIVAVPFADFGFSKLVSLVYSSFGFIGLIWTAMLIHAYLKGK